MGLRSICGRSLALQPSDAFQRLSCTPALVMWMLLLCTVCSERTTPDPPGLPGPQPTTYIELTMQNTPANILDSFHLDNKVALVTGSASGIGAAIAIALAQAGAEV